MLLLILGIALVIIGLLILFGVIAGPLWLGIALLVAGIVLVLADRGVFRRL